MGVSFTPSNQLSGGIWYLEGEDDLERVFHLLIEKKQGCYSRGTAKVEIHKAKLAELLTSMVLKNELIEVKSSTGLRDYSQIPIEETCYRLPSAVAGGAAKALPAGALASIPCGMCPRIALCTPDGVISPTCVHYKKWLDFKF